MPQPTDAASMQRPPMPGSNRDIIVIGASAGGVEALIQLVRDLPADIPAALFVVLHVGSTSHLEQVLARAGRLPVVQAESGSPIEHGRMLVAPPGRHLLLHDGHVLLRRGPRENLSRPAVDPLFRSAAASFGSRVIGVVLTGLLDDGTAGLKAIKRCGGVAVVQDPRDAAFPEMPQSALEHAPADHAVPIAALPELLVELAREKAGVTPEIPEDIRLEAAIAAQELSGMSTEDRLGVPSRFTCPECHGSLWEIEDGDLLRYRCHVGHAFTAAAALAAHDRDSEVTLWSLMRSHQERAELCRRMAQSAKSAATAASLLKRADEYDEDSRVVRELLNAQPPEAAEAGTEQDRHLAAGKSG